MTMDGPVGENLVLAGSDFDTAVSVNGVDVLGPRLHSPNSDAQLDTVHACVEAQMPGSNPRWYKWYTHAIAQTRAQHPRHRRQCRYANGWAHWRRTRSR
jgi:hypothetical protein